MLSYNQYSSLSTTIEVSAVASFPDELNLSNDKKIEILEDWADKIVRKSDDVFLYLAISTADLIENPTAEDGINGLFLLLDLLREFPFCGPVDRAVALSGILSAVVRSAITVAPLHAYRAATPGSGKSFLVDPAAAIATGQPADAITPGKTTEEMKKRLGGLLLGDSRVICLDNVNNDLGADLLCQAVERPRVDIRG